MNGIVLHAWGSWERGIIIYIDILGRRPHNVEPVFKGFGNGVSCDLLSMWGDVRFRAMVYMFGWEEEVVMR